MHARIAANGMKWAKKLEGSYVPRQAIRRHDPSGLPCPCINEGRFYAARLGSDWLIQRHIIREQGVVLAGPPPATLIDPVQPDDLRRAVREVLHEWWSPMLGDPAWLGSGEYQAFAVLTMCRALHTLQTGSIATKPVAARWAQGTLGEKWASLIEQAVAWRPDRPFDHLTETLNFIRCVLDRSQEGGYRRIRREVSLNRSS